jgi:hypothetical protein
MLIALLPGCAKRWWTDYGIQSSKQLMSQEAVPGLTAALSSNDSEVRRQALRYLSRIGVQANNAAPRVKELILKEPIESTKIYAIRTLAEISYDDDDILSFLEAQLSNETNQKIQDAYSKTITTIQGNSGAIDFAVDDTKPTELVRITFRTDYKYYNGFRRINMVQNSGILPLKIKISNNTSINIEINPDSFDLLNQNQVAANKPYQFSVVDEQQLSIAKTFIFGIPGASQAKAAVTNVRIENYFKEHVFKKSSIAPGGTVSGYVYFEIPRTTKEITGWKFKLAIDENNNSHMENYKF